MKEKPFWELMLPLPLEELDKVATEPALEAMIQGRKPDPRLAPWAKNAGAG